MTKTITFKDFINVPSYVDDEFRATILSLKESHPVIANHPVVQKFLNGDTTASFSSTQVNSILRAILQRSVTLAKGAQSQRPQDQFLIVAEQNVLIGSAVVLSAALSVHLTSSIDRLSKMVSALAEKQ